MAPKRRGHKLEPDRHRPDCKAVGMIGVSGANSDVYTANTAYNTATTSIAFGASGANFDAGSIIVYGIK